MNIYKQYKLYKQNRKILEVKFIDSKSQDKNYAIIIPYRNDKRNERKKQFDKFIKFAKKTFNDNVKIIIIEQSDFENKFNRGKLLNIGIKLSKNIEHYIFHDIDLLPDNNLLKYYSTYPKLPIHIARVWKDKYTYYTFFGGITSVSKKQILEANGFPNNFWGWGGEDDALYNRITNFVQNMYAPNKGLVKEMKHKQAEISKEDSIKKKQLILDDLKVWKKNGLNSLQYKIIKEKDITNNIKLYTVKI